MIVRVYGIDFRFLDFLDLLKVIDFFRRVVTILFLVLRIYGFLVGKYRYSGFCAWSKCFWVKWDGGFWGRS